MADINLLQNQLKDTTQVSAKRTKIVAWSCLVILVLVMAAGAVLYFLTQNLNSQIAEVTKNNADLQSQLDTKQQGLGSARAYQAQLSNISALMSNHIYMSPLIQELGKDTYQKAMYSVFDVVQSTGKIHVEGTVDSYSGLGKLLLGLSTSTRFQNVKLLSLSQSGTSQEGITFSIDMKAAPELFKKLP